MKQKIRLYKKMTFDDLSKCGIARCLLCGKVLVSTYRHDFVECGCRNGTFIDGGRDYTRVGGIDLAYVHVINSTPEPKTRMELPKTNKIGKKHKMANNI